jgi:hypothetical protein
MYDKSQKAICVTLSVAIVGIFVVCSSPANRHGKHKKILADITLSIYASCPVEGYRSVIQALYLVIRSCGWHNATFSRTAVLVLRIYEGKGNIGTLPSDTIP